MNEIATIVIFVWIVFAAYIFMELKEERRRDKK
jgi:hypothetical protein